VVVPIFAAMQAIFQILLALVAVFLILLVLVQRGRGGGLAGALGGMGGSSAFGAKAGDIFTRITIVAAAFWILLCIAAAKLGPTSAGSRLDVGDQTTSSTTGPELTPPADGEKDKAETGAEAAAENSATVPAGEAPAKDSEAASPAADESKSE
jgi:preprotein translocase subunit SecG